MNDPTRPELAVPLYFIFYFLLYVFSGSLSGKEQTPAIALAVPMQYRLLSPENTKYKGTLLLYSLGATGEFSIITHYLVEAYFLIHISFRFCLNSNISRLMFFLLFSDNLQHDPFAEQYQVMAMTWEMIIKIVTNLCTNV